MPNDNSYPVVAEQLFSDHRANSTLYWPRLVWERRENCRNAPMLARHPIATSIIGRYAHIKTFDYRRVQGAKSASGVFT
jgi:hypothetical protein